MRARHSTWNQPSRRTVLEGAGLAASGLLFPSLLGDRAAYAQTAPKRLIVFRTQHGPVTGRWEFRPPGLGGTPESEWELPLGPLAPADFTETLRPLHAVRDDVLILEGLAMTSAIADVPGNNYLGEFSQGHGLTGAMAGSKHVSFDQYVADQVAAPVRFKYLGVTPNSGDETNAGFYDSAGNAVTLNRCDNYYGFLGGQFERVFKSLPTPIRHGTDLSCAWQPYSIDFVRAQYEKLFARLGKEDRMKLSLHRDLLADLAQRTCENPLTNECKKPVTPPKGSESKIEIANIILNKLFPMAMICDLTRVGLLHHTQLEAIDIGAPSGLEVHQAIAYASGTNPKAADWMVNYYKVHAQQFAEVVATFKSIPEGNGTMLDNTILFWAPESANGRHDLFRMMYVVAGGKNLGLRPGRYLKYGETGPNPYNTLKTLSSDKPRDGYGSDQFGLGPAHSRLLVALMQALGVNRDSIGLNAATGTAYLRGVPIQMTGPLPRLG